MAEKSHLPIPTNNEKNEELTQHQNGIGPK